MILSAYVSEKRNSIFSDLTAGKPPSEGEFDREALKEGLTKGKPQMGTTRFEPHFVDLEFIYPDSSGSSVVLTVKLPAPERILFMPVPNWVVESIWQGEIDGSYHFESEAALLLAEFAEVLRAEDNGKLFGRKQAKRRE